MKHTTKEVTGCTDCLFCEFQDMSGGFKCSLSREDGHIKEDEEYNLITPIWCPLKTETITIVLKDN